jgi:hypothetical protein
MSIDIVECLPVIPMTALEGELLIAPYVAFDGDDGFILNGLDS